MFDANLRGVLFLVCAIRLGYHLRKVALIPHDLGGELDDGGPREDGPSGTDAFFGRLVDLTQQSLSFLKLLVEYFGIQGQLQFGPVPLLQPFFCVNGFSVEKLLLLQMGLELELLERV